LISKKNPSPQLLVLIVEDEVFTRFHAVDLVEAAGYRAIEASNADEAIAILESRKDIRIVFTDIDMPGSMDGIEVGSRSSRSLAANRTHSYLESFRCAGEQDSRAGSVFPETIS
jgi:CheY-like chemotaxis protein